MATATGREMLAAITSPDFIARQRDPAFVTGFAKSLGDRLASGAPWTDRQRDCLARLYREAIGAPAPGAVQVETKGLDALRALFARATARLKAPRIAFACDGHEIGLSLAKPDSRNAGAVYVHLDREYAGKVTPDSTFLPLRTLPARTQEMVGQAVARFAADPAGVAGASGRLTGRCAFCRLGLTDERSAAAGYGRDCARNYGLPWGADKVGALFADAA